MWRNHGNRQEWMHARVAGSVLMARTARVNPQLLLEKTRGYQASGASPAFDNVDDVLGGPDLHAMFLRILAARGRRRAPRGISPHNRRRLASRALYAIRSG